MPRLPERPPSWRTELLAGLTTFLTTAYIVVVNPSILSAEGTGMPFDGTLTATVLVCSACTLLMGLYAGLPYAVAPGMGINAYFTYTLVLGRGIPWQTALGMVFWAGVLFLLVSATRLRETVALAVPHGLRVGVAGGIGLFLTFIGLKNAKVVAADPVTFVKMGRLGPEAALCLLGLAVTAFLLRRKSPVAFLAGIAASTAAAVPLGLVAVPERLLAPPDFGSVFLRLDPLDALRPALWAAILGIFFTDLFDSISTFIGVSHATGLVDRGGVPLRLREGLQVDAAATLGAGLAGSSSGTAFIESAAGIEVGGRTGWTAVFCGLFFLPCFFLAPAAAMVPPFATAPALILVGGLMFRGVTGFKAERLEELLPAYFTMALIPLTFSITQGILWGFIAHAGLHAFAGRAREVPAPLWALAAVSAGLVAMEQLAHAG